MIYNLHGGQKQVSHQHFFPNKGLLLAISVWCCQARDPKFTVKQFLATFNTTDCFSSKRLSRTDVDILVFTFPGSSHFCAACSLIY